MSAEIAPVGRVHHNADTSERGIMYTHLPAGTLLYDQAALQAAREEGARQKLEYVCAWMIDGGYATGHGESMDGLLRELEEQCKERGARLMRKGQIQMLDNIHMTYAANYLRAAALSITEVLKGN